MLNDTKKLFAINNVDFTQDVKAKTADFLCSTPLSFKEKTYFAVPYCDRYEVAEKLGTLLA